MTPRELHKQAMKLRIEAGKLDAEAIRIKERNRIIKSLDIERIDSHALDDLIDTLIFMNISRSDFKHGLIKLIKGETNV